MTYFLKTTALMTCLTIASLSPVHAGPCKAKTLKTKNHIRENDNGYVEAIKKDKKTQACVEKINKKRKAVYEKIAAETPGTSLNDVEKNAAETLKNQ